MNDMSQYSILIRWSDEDNCYIATTAEFRHLSTFGNTRQEALAEMQIVLPAVLDIYIKSNWPLPVANKVTCTRKGQTT